MEQSPSSEANRYSGSQESSLLLWNPKVYGRVHKSTPLITSPSLRYPVQTFPIYISKINSNVILPSSPRSYIYSFLQVFRPQYCMIFTFVPRVLHAPFISSSLKAMVSVSQVCDVEVLELLDLYQKVRIGSVVP